MNEPSSITTGRLRRVLLMAGLPLLILVAGAGLAVAMILSRPVVERKVPSTPPPLVRVMEVERGDMTLSVEAQGTVLPRTASTLVAEVPGRVTWASPKLVNGGFFEDGDELLKLDATDYEQALAQARAEVARAEVQLARQQADAEIARSEWSRLGEGKATPLALRELQVTEARSALDAAKAAESRAVRDLRRTVVRAPYAGRVREESVDVGQFLPRGATIARIYAVDYAEVRLPLPDEDLAFIELPLSYRGESGDDDGPPVTLSSRFAGRTHSWSGRLVRTEGEIDSRTRMVYTVARVRDPYGLPEGEEKPPLAVGMFVDAEIQGVTAESVAVIPRAALRDGETVLVVDEDSRLRFRRIDVLRRTDRQAIVRAGLDDGELVCLTPLDTVVNGMEVRTTRVDPSESGREPSGEPAP
jgi:RND family efflux transporter MFP subunit